MCKLKETIDREIKFFEVKRYSKKKYIPLSKRELIRKEPSKYRNNFNNYW